MRRRPTQFLPAVLAVITCLLLSAAIHAQRRPSPVSKEAIEAWNAYVDQRAEAILLALDEDGSAISAVMAASRLLAQLTIYAPDEAVDAFLRAAERRRLVEVANDGLASG